MAQKLELAVKVGEEIRRLRNAKDISQEDLADRCGLHRTSMGAVERGERYITINTAKRIATALDCTMGEFFTAISE